MLEVIINYNNKRKKLFVENFDDLVSQTKSNLLPNLKIKKLTFSNDDDTFIENAYDFQTEIDTQKPIEFSLNIEEAVDELKDRPSLPESQLHKKDNSFLQPRYLQFLSIEPESVTLFWYNVGYNNALHHNKVLFCVKCEQFKDCYHESRIKSLSTKIKLTKLEPGTSYTFFIELYNAEKSELIRSSNLSITTPRMNNKARDLKDLENVRINQEGNTYILDWDIPEQDGMYGDICYNFHGNLVSPKFEIFTKMPLRLQLEGNVDLPEKKIGIRYSCKDKKSNFVSASRMIVLTLTRNEKKNINNQKQYQKLPELVEE